MALFPLADLLSGVKRFYVGLQGKKSDNSLETIKTNDEGALKIDGNVQLSGSYVRLSTEPLPTPEADGVKDGNDLLVIDPADKRNNKVYIYRTGVWREV